ncbi:hypothetical protein JHK87_019457 [Glycine soja]|nr:hypothetical protein JHK87_019457 [Glycine soja]
MFKDQKKINVKLFMLDVTYLYDEINFSQFVPQVEQPQANFESTPTPNAESAATPTTTQSSRTPSVETSFIPPPLPTLFRPHPIRSSTSIRIIFSDVPFHRMNKPNYMTFIPTPGMSHRQHSSK